MKSRINSSNSYMGMGIISLCVILITLAIACFAVLTYVSASSDYKLSQKEAESVSAYYEAEGRVYAKLMEAAAAAGNITYEGNASVTPSSGGYIIGAAETINETKTLHAEIFTSNGADYRIIKWQVTVVQN